MGYIYILTNPSFPQYVKIGYATDVKQRLDELNRSTAVPFAFRVYVKQRCIDSKYRNCQVLFSDRCKRHKNCVFPENKIRNLVGTEMQNKSGRKIMLDYYTQNCV